MSYNVTNQVPRLVENVGVFAPLYVGMVTMTNGQATIVLPQFSVIEGLVGTVQGATGVGETVIVTATAANTATIETVNEAGATAGSSVVMFIAWGKARL